MAVTRDGRVLTAKTALDPWADVGPLPSNADATTARFYRGGLVRPASPYRGSEEGWILDAAPRDE